MITDFYNLIKPELGTLFIALITAAISYLGHKLKVLIETKITSENIRNVVKTGVIAIEQIYKSKTSEEKLELAKLKISEILKEKKLKVSDLELLMLIEEQVHCCNKGDEK